MKQFAAAALAFTAMVGPGLAIECPITHAIYGQSTSAAQIRFHEIPRGSASNQIAAFRMEIGGTEARFDGAIHIPNGFGQPNGTLGRDCPKPDAEGTEAAVPDEGEISPNYCDFWSGVVYALGAEGIVEYPWDPDLYDSDQMAPQQLLLPEFAVNVWYSMLRGPAFDGDKMVLDVFQLTACAK